MKKLIGRLGQSTVVVLLWLSFAFGCFVAPFIAIVIFIPKFRKSEYMMNFIRAADRMAAAQCGFSGRFMLSTECVHAPCLKWLYDVLNWLEKDHCEESNFEEGSYCRISDRQIKIKK